MYFGTRAWLFSVGILAWLVSVDAAKAQDVSPLKKRLLQEAPQAWKEYEEFNLTVQGRTSAERRELTEPNKDQVSRRVVSHWKHCRGYRLIQQEIFERDSYRGAVAVYNPLYKFSLTRDSNQKPWVIREIIKREPDAKLPELEPPQGLVFGEPIKFLPLLFDSPDFKVIDVTPAGQNAEELVRLTYTYTPKDKRNGEPRSGWLVLDPNHDWLIRSGEIEIIWDEHARIKQVFDYEYKDASGHHLMATKVSLKSTVLENGRVTHEHKLQGTLDLYEQTSVPESEFTFTAFGFPEPPWLKPKRTSWYLWAALAGMVCLIASAALRWVKRRQLRVNPTLGG